MAAKVSLYPIYALARAHLDAEPFDVRVLPIGITHGVTLEDVAEMFTEDTFKWVVGEMGRRDVGDLENVRFALVHRYRDDVGNADAADASSEKLVRHLAACLRLVRPMRQLASYMRGELKEDGSIDVRHFEHPAGLMELPQVQKFYALRQRDVELLRRIAPDFLRSVEGNFWKFRMAVEFHENAHFQQRYWKARYLLWCSALEAIFTSNHREHRGSMVAKERIKWFLSPDTRIYPPGDIFEYLPQSDLTVGQIVDDLYAVRNFIAHGDRIPDEYFVREMRRGVNGPLNVVQVLLEAVSVLVRKSLLKILDQRLLHHFVGAETADAYFAQCGLTLQALRNRDRRDAGRQDVD